MGSVTVTCRHCMCCVVLASLFVLICPSETTFLLDNRVDEGGYLPTWESLDARPLPEWYDQAKVGIFLHWGVYSVPAYTSEWFWWFWQGEKRFDVVEYMRRNYRPGFTYADFASQFTAEFFNPVEWAEIFKSSGAKYVVLTSKHHEGFTLWPSQFSFNWNAMDVGPKRDLVGDLAKAIRDTTDIRFGLYHSLFEWFNPLYLADQKANFSTKNYVHMKVLPALIEVVMKYQPDLVWSDGDMGANDTYWSSKEFLAWLYNGSPVKDRVVTNDRWGHGVPCHHGGFYTCHDKYNPGVLQKHKWENCMTLDKYSWGNRRTAKYADYLTMEELTTLLAETISCGGNILINVGPTHDGRIEPMFEMRLRQLGSWLSVNGEGVYSSKPWSHQNDTETAVVWYTQRPDLAGKPVYAFVLRWPKGDVLTLADPDLTSTSTVTLLGYKAPLQWKKSKSGLQIVFPNKAEMCTDWAWVIKMTNVRN